jgi:formylglycine-generating enzyme required for sulfatase activity
MGTNPSSKVWSRVPLNEANLPVVNVTWNDVQVFIEKLNEKTGKHYRLPTEAEWEFAARGGNNSLGYLYCSGSNVFDEASWLRPNSGHLTHPVGTKKANELGIFDMTGNIWEWCQDYYGDYDSGKQVNPTGTTIGDERVTQFRQWATSVLRDFAIRGYIIDKK